MSSRRRRKKNPLLIRIIIGVVVAHAIALPIAAHFGAFEKLKKEFSPAQVVMVQVAPPEQPKKAEKIEKKPQKNSNKSEKKAPSAAKRTAAERQQDQNQPKVVASSAGPPGGDGPTVDANASGKAGAIPPPANPPSTTKDEAAGTENAKPVVKPETNTTPVVTQPKPPEFKVTPQPEPKKFVQVEATFAPEPVIPDDLRTETLDKTLVVEADVSETGVPVNIKIAESTGIKELDDVGLNTAKQYKFKPATLGDVPVQGHVRFKIIFKVE